MAIIKNISLSKTYNIKKDMPPIIINEIVNMFRNRVYAFMKWSVVLIFKSEIQAQFFSVVNS